MNEEFLNSMSVVACSLISQIKSTNDKKTKKGLLSLLLTLCRNMEDVAPRNASKKAQARADQLKLGDLRSYHFDDGPRFPGGRSNSKLHWEHWKPAVDIRSELLSLDEPTTENVKDILSQAKICWVLLDENKLLDKRGQRKSRKDPAESYKIAEIE
jgi:hypothetical protein